jgi:hypothetical protein
MWLGAQHLYSRCSLLERMAGFALKGSRKRTNKIKNHDFWKTVLTTSGHLEEV